MNVKKSWSRDDGNIVNESSERLQWDKLLFVDERCFFLGLSSIHDIKEVEILEQEEGRKNNNNPNNSK